MSVLQKASASTQSNFEIEDMEHALYKSVTKGFSRRKKTLMIKVDEAQMLLDYHWGTVEGEPNQPNGDGTFMTKFTWREKQFICVSTEQLAPAATKPNN